MIWKEKYKIGVSLIDTQHEELFRRVTDFLEMLRSSEKWDQKITKVNETLNFMKDYVVIHFRDEEAYQKSIGYPDAVNHHKIHQDMVDYVLSFAHEYEQQGYKEELVQQFAGKLLAWLINHVVATDQKVAAYARSREGVSHE